MENKITLESLNRLLQDMTIFLGNLNNEQVEAFYKKYNQEYKGKELIEIGYYGLGSYILGELPFTDPERNPCFIRMERKDYNYLSECIEKAGIGKEHINKFASILQEHICRKLLNEIYKPYLKTTQNFENEFAQLNEIAPNDIKEIKFIKYNKITNFKNEHLIKFLLDAYKLIIEHLPMGRALLDRKSEGIQDKFYDKELASDKINQSAAISLLKHLQSYTNYKYNVTNEQATAKKFNNKQYALIGEMMYHARLIEQSTHHSAAKDLDIRKKVRNWIQRDLKPLYMFDEERGRKKIEEIFKKIQLQVYK